jgi:hypothetical protein
MTESEMIDDYNRGELEWESKNGRTTVIQNLPTPHLKNIITVINNNTRVLNLQTTWKGILDTELYKRNNFNKLFELQDAKHSMHNTNIQLCLNDSSIFKTMVTHDSYWKAFNISKTKFEYYMEGLNKVRKLKYKVSDRKALDKLDDLERKAFSHYQAWKYVYDKMDNTIMNDLIYETASHAN